MGLASAEVFRAPVSDIWTQRWTFAEVAEGVYIIANDGLSDGPFLSAIEGCRALLPTEWLTTD